MSSQSRARRTRSRISPRSTARSSREVFALRLKDETRIRRDVWERAGEDSLRGVFLGMPARKIRLGSAPTPSGRR